MPWVGMQDDPYMIDVDQCPTLDEESLGTKERLLVERWAAHDPDLAKRVKEEGPEVVGMHARRHLAIQSNMELMIRSRTGLHPLQVMNILEEQEREFFARLEEEGKPLDLEEMLEEQREKFRAQVERPVPPE